MTQLDLINKKLIPVANGRKIVDDRKVKTDLTDDEFFLIEKAVSIKRSGAPISTIHHISRRYHLDFVGWDNEQYWDVLLCSNKG